MSLNSVSYILSMVRSGLGVMTSRIFGLIRDIIVAAVYGATGVTDIFFVAFAIPNLFRQFFAEGAIASAFVPFLSDKTKQGAQQANAYMTQLIFMQTIIITGISIILILFAPYVIMLFMPGVAGNQADVAIGATLLRILMPYLFFVSISGLLSGWLNIAGSYYIGYASVSCLNIAMIIGAIIGGIHDGNIYTLAISVFAGGLCQMFMVYAYSWLKGFRFTALAPADPDVKNTYKLLIPSLAGVGISQMNFLVGRIIASFLQPGSISWLFYANRLFQFPLGVFSVTIATVSLTELSKARTNDDIQNVHRLIDKAIIAVMLIIIPATIGLVGLAREITELIFARNAFTQFDVINTASALQMYSIGLLFYSLAAVFTRVFHSEKNIKTPVKVAAVTFLINLAGNLILMRYMAHAGIALASTIAAGVNAVILYYLIKGYRFNIKANIKLILKIILAAYIMTATLITAKIMGLHVLINISACILVYFGLLGMMRVNVRGIFR